MAKIRITKRAIDALLNAEAGAIIRDDKLVGFQARKNANGTVYEAALTAELERQKVKA